jgi:hypothetical protein
VYVIGRHVISTNSVLTIVQQLEMLMLICAACYAIYRECFSLAERLQRRSGRAETARVPVISDLYRTQSAFTSLYDDNGEFVRTKIE